VRWTYPHYERDEFRKIKPIAELWDERSGMRVALVCRADNWPESSYKIVTPVAYHRFNDVDTVEMQGDCLEAQELAVAMARLA